MIQRRDDYGGDNRENFNRDWDDYKSGFGDPDHEFWLGNENIYMLTNAEDYSLRVELEDFEGNKRYAQNFNKQRHISSGNHFGSRQTKIRRKINSGKKRGKIAAP